MSSFDDLVGGAFKAVAGDKAAALNRVLSGNGGLSGLAHKFQNGGAGDVFARWVSSGDHQTISAEAIDPGVKERPSRSVFSKTWVASSQASQFIAQYLPQMINQLTPHGQVSAAEPSAGA